MEAEHYKKLAAAPGALRSKLEAFKAEQGEPLTAPPLPPPPPSPDPEKKRLGTALYKRIFARVPTTTCPEDKVLQMGLRVHRMVMEREIHYMKTLMGKNTEAFDTELECMIADFLATDKLVEASKQPNNSTMNDDKSGSYEVPFGTAICRTRATHFFVWQCLPLLGRNG